MGLDALVLADEDGTDDPDGRTAVFTVNEGAAMVGLYNEVVQKTDSFTAAKKVEGGNREALPRGLPHPP